MGFSFLKEYFYFFLMAFLNVRFRHRVLYIFLLALYCNFAFGEDNLTSQQNVTVTCNTEAQLSNIPNLKKYMFGDLEVGSKINLECASLHGIVENAKVSTSYQAVCEADGKLKFSTDLQCIPVCSIAEAVHPKNGVMQTVTFKNNGKEELVAKNKLVPEDTEVTISCLFEHFLEGQEDESVTNDSFYQYKCSTANPSKIKRCLKKAQVMCDPAEELGMIPNLGYYWHDKVPAGQSLTISCAANHGYFEEFLAKPKAGLNLIPVDLERDALRTSNKNSSSEVELLMQTKAQAVSKSSDPTGLEDCKQFVLATEPDNLARFGCKPISKTLCKISENDKNIKSHIFVKNMWVGSSLKEHFTGFCKDGTVTEDGAKNFTDMCDGGVKKCSICKMSDILSPVNNVLGQATILSGANSGQSVTASFSGSDFTAKVSCKPNHFVVGTDQKDYVYQCGGEIKKCEDRSCSMAHVLSSLNKTEPKAVIVTPASEAGKYVDSSFAGSNDLSVRVYCQQKHFVKDSRGLPSSETQYIYKCGDEVKQCVEKQCTLNQALATINNVKNIAVIVSPTEKAGQQVSASFGLAESENLKVKVSCKPNFRVTGTLNDTEYLYTCGGEVKKCEEIMCPVASVFAPQNNVSDTAIVISPSDLKDRAVSSSSMVPLSSSFSMKVSCAPGYKVHGTNETSYIYKCGDEPKKCYRPTHQVQSSFTVKCQENGKFTGWQGVQCKPSCSIANALSYGNKVKAEAFIINPPVEPVPVTTSNLVEDGSKVLIECLPDHVLEAAPGVPSTETKYLYTCNIEPTLKQEPKKCMRKTFVYPIIKPTSSSTGKIDYACNVNHLLGVTNTVITKVDGKSGTISDPFLAPGKVVELSCSPSTSVVLGGSKIDSKSTAVVKGKLVEKFNVTCDHRGSGKFFLYDSSGTSDSLKYLPVPGCSVRCNIDALALRATMPSNSASKPRIDILPQSSTPPNNTTVFTNDTNNLYKYVSIGNKVRVNCPDGYAIRSTNERSYETACGVTDFDRVEVCEPEILPCDVSELMLDGIVYSPKGKVTISGPTNAQRLSGGTLVGQTVDIRCQGGDDYFMKSGSQTSLPRCVYDPITKRSKWDNLNFKCYDGCIVNSGTHGTLKITTDSLRPVYRPVQFNKVTYNGCRDRGATPSDGGWLIAPDCTDTLNNAFPEYLAAVGGRIPKELQVNFHFYNGIYRKSPYLINSVTPLAPETPRRTLREMFNMKYGTLGFTVDGKTDAIDWIGGYQHVITVDAFLCLQRQTLPKNYIIESEFLTIGTVTAGNERPNPLFFDTNTDYCEWRNDKGACLGKINGFFNTFLKKESRNIGTDIRTGMSNADICEKIFEEIKSSQFFPSSINQDMKECTYGSGAAWTSGGGKCGNFADERIGHLMALISCKNGDYKRYFNTVPYKKIMEESNRI